MSDSVKLIVSKHGAITVEVDLESTDGKQIFSIPRTEIDMNPRISSICHALHVLFDYPVTVMNEDHTGNGFEFTSMQMLPCSKLKMCENKGVKYCVKELDMDTDENTLTQAKYSVLCPTYGTVYNSGLGSKHAIFPFLNEIKQVKLRHVLPFLTGVKVMHDDGYYCWDVHEQNIMEDSKGVWKLIDYMDMCLEERSDPRDKNILYFSRSDRASEELAVFYALCIIIKRSTGEPYDREKIMTWRNVCISIKDAKTSDPILSDVADGQNEVKGGLYCRVTTDDVFNMSARAKGKDKSKLLAKVIEVLHRAIIQYNQKQ